MLKQSLCEENIFGYLHQYGSQTCKEQPFGEVDGLILAQLAYLKFQGMVPRIRDEKDGVALRWLVYEKNWKNLFRNSKFSSENKELFRLLVKSERFGDMRLNYHVDLIDEKKETQFSAITFLLKEGPLCIAFRGTDENVIGWKENLNMIFKKPVPAQEYAASYLNKVADLSVGNMILCGHSKGGNLAAYAGVKCKKQIGERITEIFNYDGPGFRMEFLNNAEYVRNVQKIKKYVTPESIVGYLLWSLENVITVDNCEKGVKQHCAYYWKVKDDRFDIIKGESEGRKCVERWNQKLAGLSVDKLKTVVDTLYSIMKMTESDRIQNAVSAIGSMKGMDRETAKILMEAVTIFRAEA